LLGADAEEEVDGDEAMVDGVPFVARLFICFFFIISSFFRLEKTTRESSGQSSWWLVKPVTGQAPSTAATLE
jgi:hypothetical protein